MSNYEQDHLGEKLLEETIAYKVATMALAGKTSHAIGKELNISWRQVKKHLNSHRCKEVMREIKDAYVTEAQNRLRTEAAQLVNEAVETLKFHLKEKNLHALPHVFKLLEIDKDAPAQAQQAVMQIVLPDSNSNAVNITPKKRDEDEVS